MKKVHDATLEAVVEDIIAQCEDSEDAAAHVVELLRELQDANGIKVCQNVSVEDLAYREV